MDIIRMTGGMGNQMFQYALFLKLCSMGKAVKFDDVSEYKKPNAREIMLWPFGIHYPIATEDEINELTDGCMKISHRIRRKFLGRKSLEYHENDCNFDAKVLEKENAYLTGYFQSELYFKDIEETVRDAFTFQPVIYEKLPKELKKAVLDYQKEIENCTSVSIHIRRGDYLLSREIYGGNCTQEYYTKAVSIIKGQYAKAVFFVFSNDEKWVIDWCEMQEEKNLCQFVPVLGVSEEMGYIDMMLMSKCKHHIIANSSFSWWGAWLNPSDSRCVIAPAKWFNHQECKDIYSEGMIRVTAKGEVLI